jgi:predicted dehydrogenase
MPRRNEAMNVAVIGCGYWGKNLVRNFNQLDALAMVCDATPAGRATAINLVPHAEVTADVEDALRADVSGVVIATPAESHATLARRALQAGKDVLVEKPLALTYEQGTALVGWLKSNNAS